MTNVSQIVQDMIAEREANETEAKEAARRQEVRAAALEFGRTWAAIITRPAEELPAGIQGDSEACVFANLLGGTWDGTVWRPHEGSTEITLPPEVQEFIHRFDNDEYPDLAKLGVSEDG